jgi:hypothetical protein
MRKIATAFALLAGATVLVGASYAWNQATREQINNAIATVGQQGTTVTLPAAPTLVPLTQGTSSAAPTLTPATPTPTATEGDSSTDQGGVGISVAATATPIPTTPAGIWSVADCTWAAATLTEDQTLDQATATRESSSFYQGWANRWGSEIYYVVTPVCTTTTQPTYDAVVNFIVWNGCAQQTHLSDGNPNDAAWNAMWAGNYARLNGMAFELESSYGWPPTDAGTGGLDCP